MNRSPILYLKRAARPLLLLLSLALAFGASVQVQAASLLQAEVDRRSLTLEETLTLNLRYNKQNLFGEPKFDTLEMDFEILSRNQSSKYQFINGRSESWTLWSLTLAPRRTGQLTIPAFEYDGEQSQAINLEVTNTPVSSNSSDQPVYLEVSLDKDSLYVQEQLLLTIKLFTSVDLGGLNSEDLALGNALVTQVSEHQYQRTIKGKPYGVVEVSYAIFPQQSGELIIPSLVWTVAVQAPRRQNFDPYNRDPFASMRAQASKRLRLRTPEKHIQVRPQPENTKGQPWLPAQQLQLSESWSQAADTFVVGEPITRTINITAKGLMASQLPPLKIEALDGVKFYPDQPQSDDQSNAEGVTGSRRESFAIVPNKAGSMTLPAVTLSWWDTQNQRLQKAQLPAKTIRVTGGAKKLASDTVAFNPPMELEKIDPAQVSQDSPDAQPRQSLLWPTLSGLGLIGSLLFALLWWRSRQQLLAQHSHSHAPADNFKQNKKSEDKSAALKALQKLLKNAGAPNSASAELSRELRLALLHWGKVTLGVQSLQQITASAPETLRSQLGLLLQRFDASRYSSDQTQPVSASEYQQLSSLVTQLDKLLQTDAKNTAAEALPPLYPAG